MTIVPPSGPTNSPPLAIIGEAPGEHEEREGRPFVGPSGHLLTQMLAQAGVGRGDCYITNVSNVRPPKNDFGAMFYDDPKRRCPNLALLDHRERLQQEMREVKPKVIVCMGAEALKAFGVNHSLSNVRGTMLYHYGYRILPTFHPAYILRTYSDRPIVEADLRKAYRQAINPSLPTTNFNDDPSFLDVMDFLKNARAYRRLALDIETVGYSYHTRCIGFAWSKWDAISIPLVSKGTHHWTLEEEEQILTELDKLFQSPDIEFILQNGPFDLTTLAREFGFFIKNYTLDTMFAHHLLFPELPKGLDFLSSIYTDHEAYWEHDKTNDKANRKYNCYDCVVTFEAAEEIEDQFKQRNLTDFYRRVIHPAVYALMRMQSRGVLIDEVARKEIAVETEKTIVELMARIATLLGRDLNPSSPKQVKELIYDEWKLPAQKKPRATTTTADEDALKALIRSPKLRNEPTKREILETVIKCRQARVLLGTFADMPLDKGRVRTSYNLAGTVTGRISSSRTPDGFGGNLQNIPRGAFRRIFRADPGKVLIKADLSQAEYRVLIWKARITRVIDRLLDPHFSIHMWNAAENIYRVPYGEVTKQMYQDAKNGVYGANYGIGAHKVSRMYDIDFQKAKMIIERYHAAVTEIQGVYQAEIKDQINTTRSLINPLGRERIFFGRLDDDTFRAAYSHYCQSTVADLILEGLIELDAGPDWFELLLQVHDELVAQVPIERVEEGCAMMKKAMERPLTFPGVERPLVIPVEIKVGFDWYNTKSLSDFLKEQNDVREGRPGEAQTPLAGVV